MPCMLPVLVGLVPIVVAAKPGVVAVVGGHIDAIDSVVVARGDIASLNRHEKGKPPRVSHKSGVPSAYRSQQRLSIACLTQTESSATHSQSQTANLIADTVVDPRGGAAFVAVGDRPGKVDLLAASVGVEV